MTPRMPQRFRCISCANSCRLKTVGVDGRDSKRVTWCCAKLFGYLLDHYRCKGPESPECPGFTQRCRDDAETFRRERDNMPEEPMSEKGG